VLRQNLIDPDVAVTALARGMQQWTASVAKFRKIAAPAHLVALDRAVECAAGARARDGDPAQPQP
jgi:hypothetical protein